MCSFVPSVLDISTVKMNSRKKNTVASCELPLSVIPQEMKSSSACPVFRIIVTDHSSQELDHASSPVSPARPRRVSEVGSDSWKDFIPNH